MSNKTPKVFSYPREIQKQFFQLTQSKWAFLENLSPAERIKLETLYDQLQNAWSQNSTSKLNEDLNLRYQELRKIQSEIKTDWTTYESNIAEEHRKDIEIRSKRLVKRKAYLPKLKQENLIGFSKILTMLKASEKATLMIWKADILEKEQKLKDEEIKLKSTLQRKNVLLKNVQESETSQAQFEELQQEYKRKLKALTNLESNLKESLMNTEQANNQDIQLHLQISEEESIPYKKNLNEKKKNLQDAWSLKKQKLLDQSHEQKENLESIQKSTEQELYNFLKEHILKDLNCPTDLQNYLKQDQFSMIGMRNKTLLTETEQRWNALIRGLTRNGIDQKRFLERFESNQRDKY